MITSPLNVRIASGIAEIPSPTLYAIAQLRQRVFVVEQECVYLDLDGRDLEPGALQLWCELSRGQVVGTVRILREESDEPGLRSIGRVVTDPAYRGQGIAGALLETAIAECAGDPIRIHVQAHLEGWYARYGFTTCGDEFLEDGIPHLPMRRN